MRLATTPAELANALGTVAHAVPSRSTTPILAGVLLRAEEAGMLTVTATDLELTIRVRAGARVVEPGEAVLPFRYIFDLVRHFSGGEVELAVDGVTFAATLRWGRGQYEVNGYDPGQYPVLPPAPEGSGAAIPDASLRLWSRQTVFAAATDVSRPALTGVLWDFGENSLRLVATDGTRLAYRQAEAPAVKPDKGSILIPARALQQVLRMPAAEQVVLKVGTNYVWFEWPGALLASRLLAGQYPEYRQVIPKAYVCQVRTERVAFHDACQRAALVGREGVPCVRLQVEPGRVMVTSQAAAVGSTEEEVAAEVEGQPLQFLFNANLLLEGIRVLEGKELLFQAAGAQTVCTISDPSRQDFRYFVLPLKQER